LKKCPLLNKKCIEHDCEWFIHLVGLHPQTGQPQDEWGCAIKWLPVLLVESAGMTRNVSAALDRNNNTFFNALPDHLQQRVVSKNSNILANGKQ